MTEIFLKTQQVADAFEIGVSTVKRWVDRNELVALRTVGRHRLIPLSEARRFAKSRNISTTRLDALAVSLATRALMGLGASAIDDLLTSLKEGNAVETKSILIEGHLRLGCAARLADELIQPVMMRVGQGWADGTWSIYEEHQASLLVARTLNEMIAGIPRKRNAPLALGASAPGDNATIALLLGELTLREAGWEVRNLGPNLPLSSLAEAIQTYEPALVFLTICHLTKSPAEFLHDYLQFHRVAVAHETAVVLGGRALGPELRSKLPYTSFGDRMSHLAELGRRLLDMNAGVDQYANGSKHLTTNN